MLPKEVINQLQQQQHFISPHNIQEIKIYNNSTDDDRGARNIKKHSDKRKTTATYIQQVIGQDKGRALLHFKQIDLNERGSSQ